MAGKVFLACALGGGIGAFFALQMWSPLWWLGMIVGGFIGYLTYEFKEVIRAVPWAWRKATGWHPNWERWKVFLRLLPTTAIGLPAVVALPISLFLLQGYAHGNNVKVKEGLVATLVLCFIIFCWLSLLFAAMDTRRIIHGFTDLSVALQEHRRFNVFRVYFLVLPRAVAKGVWRSPRWIARGAITIARFLRYLFILVHSEVRLLCGLDAALGAAIGYYFGHSIVGAIAGGIIGVANFEVISKRWLHLVPSRSF